MLAGMWEKREPWCTIDGNVKWCTHYGKQYGVSLKNKKELPFYFYPAILLLDRYAQRK